MANSFQCSDSPLYIYHSLSSSILPIEPIEHPIYIFIWNLPFRPFQACRCFPFFCRARWTELEHAIYFHVASPRSFILVWNCILFYSGCNCSLKQFSLSLSPSVFVSALSMQGISKWLDCSAIDVVREMIHRNV